MSEKLLMKYNMVKELYIVIVIGNGFDLHLEHYTLNNAIKKPC